MEILRLLSANEMLAQIVSFLCLLWFLKVFFWRKILKVLDERKEKIAAQFKQLENSQAQAEQLKTEYLSGLSAIEETAQAKQQEAIQQGEEAAKQLRLNAQEEAKKIVEDARQSLRYEVAKAKEQLKGEIVELVLDATQRVIEEKITEKADRKAVEDFINQVDSAPPKS